MICEYKVFANEQSARDEARKHASDDEVGEWAVYPLYAGEPAIVN